MVDTGRLVKTCNISQWECVLALHNAEYKDKIKQKAECITGNDSEDNEEYLGENIKKYLTKKTKEESVVMRIKEEDITLDDDMHYALVEL
eukprot:4867890-Ditylum_brightwellii.AAC.1